MSPARGKRASVKKTKQVVRLLVKTIILIFIALASVYFVRTKYWLKDGKPSLVINAGETIYVAAFDPKHNEITTVLIPGGTEVDVARNMGKWKIKSVFALGENERLSGRLLAETVAKNFKFPVSAWAEEDALGFIKGDASLFKSLFSLYKTNLTIGDKLQIALFSLRVKSFKREEIDLSETSVLRKTRLKDGEDGFVIGGSVSQNIQVAFSDPLISSYDLKVSIKDFSGGRKAAFEMGKVIETLGAKVLTTPGEVKKELDCEVATKNAELAKHLSLIFGCKIVSLVPEGSLDAEVVIGKKFAERF